MLFNYIECHFEETHVGTNTEFYYSIGMVTNILLRLHVDLVEKDSYSNTTETFAHVIAWLKLGNVNNASHFRLSITSRPTVSQHVTDTLPTSGLQSNDSWSTVGRQSLDKPSTVGR